MTESKDPTIRKEEIEAWQRVPPEGIKRLRLMLELNQRTVIAALQAG